MSAKEWLRFSDEFKTFKIQFIASRYKFGIDLLGLNQLMVITSIWNQLLSNKSLFLAQYFIPTAPKVRIFFIKKPGIHFCKFRSYLQNNPINNMWASLFKKKSTFIQNEWHCFNNNKKTKILSHLSKLKNNIIFRP